MAKNKWWKHFFPLKISGGTHRKIFENKMSPRHVKMSGRHVALSETHFGICFHAKCPRDMSRCLGDMLRCLGDILA